ncbi:MAG: DivIVA domain-containing protein [Actinomycetales bacterium]|nr:DivIVA domain-containing protein [Actinomycetales bacterium]
MPITAAEVRATQFATTRMRAGYDMDEVDAFLDIIEADVAQYADELQRSRDGEAVLRTQCDQLQARLVAGEQRLAEVQEQLATARKEGAVGPAEPVVPEELAAQLGEHPEAEAVLALAQRTADEIVRYAQARADAIRAAVRATLDEQRRLLDVD